MGILARRWGRITRLLLNPGDTLLVEEWTYPSALATAFPVEVRWRAVPMDSQGMCADALREILAGWNVEKDGSRCVCSYYRLSFPGQTGQAAGDLYCPCWTEPVRDSMSESFDCKLFRILIRRRHQTMGLARKKAIYDICVEYGRLDN